MFFKYIRTSLLITTLFFTIGCEEQTTWDFQQTELFVVVDAIITSEFKHQEIKVYSSLNEFNGEFKPIVDANIRVTDGVTVYTFIPYVSMPGLYISEVPFATTVDNIYALFIDYSGISDTAYAIASAISPFRNDTVYFNNNFYKFVYGGSNLPAMTEVYYDWSNNTAYCDTFGSCFAAETYYTLNSIDLAEEFGPTKQQILFPSGTTLIRKKYSLSSAHQDFLRSLLIETEWRGGLFDIEQGNVPTNFKNGTLGWFAACMVISDTNVVD